MPTKTFYLDKNSSESITIHYGFNWKNLTITKDDEIIGRVEKENDLKKGRSFEYENGKVISIQLSKKFGFIQELEILLNGNPIPGSSTEPSQQVKQVYQVLLFIAAVNTILGFVAETGSIDFLKALGLGYETMVIGTLYGLLAYFIKFRLSVIALYVAFGLLLLDIILTMVFAAEMSTNPTSGLFMKGMFALILFNGIPALKKVRKTVALS